MPDNRIDNILGTTKAIDKLLERVALLESSCEARSRHHNDILFEELGKVMGSLANYVVMLNTALLINAGMGDGQQEIASEEVEPGG